MKVLLTYWFKIQANKAAKVILTSHYSKDETQDILHGYWLRYLKLRPDIPVTSTLGGSLMLHLAAMSTAFYQELIERGQTDDVATRLFYNIAWKVYQKMGKFSWWLAGWGNKSGYSKLLKATRLFRTFPFNSPSYQWQDVKSDKDVVGFNCLKCPVANYFETKGLSKFCASTWCALDFPLAEMWDAKLERTGSIAGGADKCDFRWKVKNDKVNI